MSSPLHSPQRIDGVSELIQRLQRERTAARLSQLEKVCDEILSHLQSWRDRLRTELAEGLNRLEVGCPPSFVRVAGQSHLEKPFNRLLGWMVDPSGDHGWGDGFLRLLAEELDLPEMIADLESWDAPEIRCEQILDGDDSGKQPDLAIRTRSAALLIENKVGAPESGDQYVPYLRSFHIWAGDRQTRAFLSAREVRDKPTDWTGFIAHADLAKLLYRIGEGETNAPTWARITAVICAVTFEDRDDAEILHEARLLLEKTTTAPATVDQVSRLRQILPLPESPTPWTDPSEIDFSQSS